MLILIVIYIYYIYFYLYRYMIYYNIKYNTVKIRYFVIAKYK